MVGGGPAGSVTATVLAREGVRVALIHADRAIRLPVGEVLPPAARPTFERLGLASVLDEPAHLGSPGNVSAWGSAEPRTSDFLFSPYGDGLHLDRARFDADLRNVAQACGARVRVGLWNAPHAGAADPDNGSVRVIVDCSGRSSAVARARGARIDRLDRLVAIVGVLTPRMPSADTDARTFVASVPEGWWYSALLPDGRRVAAFHTDVDLLSAPIRHDPRVWHAMLLRAPVIGSLVAAAAAAPPESLKVLAADSRRLGKRPSSLDGAPAVVVAGDAAMAFDPLSSQGILSAVQSAEEAAIEIRAILDRADDTDDVAATTRAGAAQERWSRYVDRLSAAYRDEQRWPDSPFWTRRLREGNTMGSALSSSEHR